MSLKPSNQKMVLRAAATMEKEAETWADGFASRYQDGSIQWNDKEYDWAHVRYLRLMAGARALRALATSKSP